MQSIAGNAMNWITAALCLVLDLRTIGVYRKLGTTGAFFTFEDLRKCHD